MSVGRLRWTWRSRSWTACWSWDARPTSASPEPRQGWGNCARIPDPCTTARLERAAAHTGHPNQDTHAEAGQHIGQTGRGQRGHARLMLLGYSAQSSFEGDAQEELNGQASCEMHAWKRLRACAT